MFSRRVQSRSGPKRSYRDLLALFISVFFVAFLSGQAFAQDKKPNILVIWGDDIGSRTSAPTQWASWATARPTSTASPTKA